MAKSGTTTSCGNKMKSMTTSGVKHGPSEKNVTKGAKSKPAPSSGGRTKPIKGMDRGGV